MGSGDSKPEEIKILMYGFDDLAKEDLMSIFLQDREPKVIESLNTVHTSFIQEDKDYQIWDLFND